MNRSARLFARSLALTLATFLSFGAMANNNAFGDILYNNWTTPTGENNPLDGSYLAQSFNTGATAETLTSVSVMIRTLGASPSNTYSMLLYGSNGSNKPGALLATIGQKTLGGGVSPDQSTTLPNPDFTFTANYLLASASQYFVVLKVDNTTSTDGIFWKNSTSIPTNDINITPNPSYYSYYSFNGTAWGVTSGNFNMVVTAVPEPSTSILGAIGVMTMAYVAKRKRRSIA